ncbi:MAG: glycosyltransferase family 2 protein [Candidatus Aenigmarchaeota archaeon]|nr:glycosyltransferase family 2 protein [Candidatus Aenigmarchaeota archaeon]
MSDVGILFPAYNEENNIKNVIKEAKKYLPAAKILVVDDGSSDRTVAISKKEAVHVVTHAVNKGKGEALKSGLKFFNKAKSVKYIVVADADRQYSVKEAKLLLEPLLNDEADVVMGRRNFKRIPLRHRLGNFAWRTTFNALFGTSMDDTNCGFIAMKKSAANLILNASGGGYIIENAMMIEAIKHRLRIKQVDVSVNYRRTSAVPRGIKMVAGVLVFILKNGIRYRLGR